MPEHRLEHALNYCQDRRESNKKYYEKHKKRWKKYRRKAKIKAKKVLYGDYNYVALTDKQKKFKKAVEQGIEPVEAVKRAYPAEENPGSKLSKLKQNPILASAIDRYVATMLEVGFTDEFEAKKLHTIAKKTDGESNPHADRNTILVLQDWRKTRGLDVERSESRSLNINITMTEEQMEFFLRKQEEKEEAIDV